jgi:hypothetical protein
MGIFRTVVHINLQLHTAELEGFSSDWLKWPKKGFGLLCTRTPQHAAKTSRSPEAAAIERGLRSVENFAKLMRQRGRRAERSEIES